MMELRAQAIHKNNTKMIKKRVQITFIIVGWYIYFEVECYVSIQMMLKNHFSCYVVIKATYQSFHSNTVLDARYITHVKYIKVHTVSLYDH